MTSEDRALFSAVARAEACQHEVCYWRATARRLLTGEMIAVGSILAFALAFAVDPQTRLVGIGCTLIAVAWLLLLTRLWWLLRGSK